ncbi:MAG: VTC domain-containing protein [Candidatus Omnitrophota bacterium]
MDHVRYERKFFITDLTEFEIISILNLHPANFSRIYYERYINNIYIDSFDMKNYFENISGLENRVKYRVRWYGDLFGEIKKPHLELKIKRGLTCAKRSFLLKGFMLDQDFCKDVFYDVVRSSDIPETLKLELGCLDFSLLNRYRRKYYISKDNRYRVTLDSDLEFYGIDSFNSNFLNESKDHISNIIEVKYEKENEESIKDITSLFPFRMTKSSKYVMGLERLNFTKRYSQV